MNERRRAWFGAGLVAFGLAGMLTLLGPVRFGPTSSGPHAGARPVSHTGETTPALAAEGSIGSMRSECVRMMSSMDPQDMMSSADMGTSGADSMLGMMSRQ